ncbi:MAG: hypothetical protein ABW173_03670, partial [Sphingomonas sp.]
MSTAPTSLLRDMRVANPPARSRPQPQRSDPPPNPVVVPVETVAPAAAPRRRRRPIGLVLAALFLLALAVAALAPGLIAPGDPLEGSARDAFLSPGAAHLLGTDENGR